MSLTLAGRLACPKRKSVCAPLRRLSGNLRRILESIGPNRVAKTVMSPMQRLEAHRTKRRGNKTKPFMSSLRLTISMRSEGTFATAAST
jgi:hypothetical protein